MEVEVLRCSERLRIIEDSVSNQENTPPIYPEN